MKISRTLTVPILRPVKYQFFRPDLFFPKQKEDMKICGREPKAAEKSFPTVPGTWPELDWKVFYSANQNDSHYRSAWVASTALMTFGSWNEIIRKSLDFYIYFPEVLGGTKHYGGGVVLLWALVRCESMGVWELGFNCLAARLQVWAQSKCSLALLQKPLMALPPRAFESKCWALFFYVPFNVCSHRRTWHRVMISNWTQLVVPNG